MATTFNLRRCGGNRSAWCLSVVREDGTESPWPGDRWTAMTIDTLLARAANESNGRCTINFEGYP